MPDGSHSPDAPITVYVDGDIQALPFMEDLKRAGLRLVNEGGKTYLRPLAERDEPEETERDTIPRLLERAREELNRAEVAYAIPEASLVLNNYAWPRMHKGHRAVCFALRAIDPAAVETMNLEIVFDDEEREMIDRTEAMHEKYD